MTKLTIALALAGSLSAAGCTKKGGADCDKALDRSMELSKAEMSKAPGVDDKMLQKMRDLGVQHCKDDKWPDDVRACMTNAKTMSDSQACYGKLTQEQQDKMNNAAMALATAATPATGSAAAGSAQPAAGSAPAPAAAPTPVKMTADQLKPQCDKMFTADVMTKAYGATKVEQKNPGGDKPLAICEMSKGDEVVGTVTVACNPDLDVTMIEKERAAMTKAKDLPAGIGRGGYRISNAFFFNDDETPCRINANYMNPPEDEAALADSLRAIMAAINPSTLK